VDVQPRRGVGGWARLKRFGWSAPAAREPSRPARGASGCEVQRCSRWAQVPYGPRRNATRGVTPFSWITGRYRLAMRLLNAMWRLASSVSGISGFLLILKSVGGPKIVGAAGARITETRP